jgi:hypothetical protein
LGEPSPNPLSEKELGLFDHFTLPEHDPNFSGSATFCVKRSMAARIVFDSKEFIGVTSQASATPEAPAQAEFALPAPEAFA